MAAGASRTQTALQPTQGINTGSTGRQDRDQAARPPRAWRRWSGSSLAGTLQQSGIPPLGPWLARQAQPLHLADQMARCLQANTLSSWSCAGRSARQASRQAESRAAAAHRQARPLDHQLAGLMADAIVQATANPGVVGAWPVSWSPLRAGGGDEPKAQQDLTQGATTGSGCWASRPANGAEKRGEERRHQTPRPVCSGIVVAVSLPDLHAGSPCFQTQGVGSRHSRRLAGRAAVAAGPGPPGSSYRVLVALAWPSGSRATFKPDRSRVLS